jgi:hypothetical protein
VQCEAGLACSSGNIETRQENSEAKIGEMGMKETRKKTVDINAGLGKEFD